MTDSTKLFDKMFSEYLEQNDISGSIQIIDHDKIIYRKNFGYQNREEKIPVSDDTVFRFYSISKPFIAIGIMQLYEKGLISLDDRLCDVLPIASNLNKDIKIINLLQHTSGLPEITTTEKILFVSKVDFKKEIDEIANKALDFPVGEGSTYRNTNYILLSLIIEHLSGMELPEYLKKNIFDPLGMKTATCELNDKKPENLAVGYELVNKKIIPAIKINTELLFGSGYIVGRMNDVTCLYKAIREKKLLKPETWDLVFTKSPICKFGLGCAVLEDNGILCYQHNGGHKGFRLLHKYFPDNDFDYIILINSSYGTPREDISKMIYKCYLTDEEYSSDFVMDKGFAN